MVVYVAKTHNKYYPEDDRPDVVEKIEHIYDSEEKCKKWALEAAKKYIRDEINQNQRVLKDWLCSEADRPYYAECIKNLECILSYLKVEGHSIQIAPYEDQYDTIGWTWTEMNLE